MKRLILRVAVMVLTFIFGIGIDRTMSRQNAPQHPEPHPVAPVVTETPAPAVATTEPMTEGIPTSTPAVIFDYPAKFAPDGEYFIMGEAPLELREFQWMLLQVSEVNNGRMWGYISLQTKVGDTYGYHEAAFGLVTSRRVFFVTSNKSRVGYRFDGEFLFRDLQSAMDKDKAVLRGTLTKTFDGRKVAEYVVSFRLEFHGC
jgi:hypothetical protein